MSRNPFGCPHCSHPRCVSLAPILRFRAGKKRPKHDIVGFVVQCFACSKKFEMSPEGAVATKATKATEAVDNGRQRDHERERMTEAALRSQGPLVPREPPGY